MLSKTTVGGGGHGSMICTGGVYVPVGVQHTPFANLLGVEFYNIPSKQH